MRDNTTAYNFDDWWNASNNWVEQPNFCRNGWSGVVTHRHNGTLFFIKKQSNHLYRSLAHPLGQPTVTREYRNILRLNKLNITVPEPVFYAAQKSPDGYLGLLVTCELLDFQALSTQTNLSTDQKELLAIAVGKVIARLHRAHLQHSCLYDNHIMVRWQHQHPEIALIDLEKMRRPFLPWQAAQHDLDQLKRHQKLWDDSMWKRLLDTHATELKR